jgi:hypothetical protein
MEFGAVSFVRAGTTKKGGRDRANDSAGVMRQELECEDPELVITNYAKIKGRTMTAAGIMMTY